MATYRSSGDRQNLTAPTGGYTAGTPVQFPAAGATAVVGVPLTTAAAGEQCAVAFEGDHLLSTKKAGVGEAWSFGALVYITPTGDLTDTASTNAYAGRCWEPGGAATGDTTARVKINWGNN